MSWMVPLEIAITFASIIQALVYSYLYMLYRERFMGIWAAGWAVDTLINIFDLGAVFFQKDGFSMAGFQIFFLFSGLLLLWGTSVFWEKKMSSWWVSGSFLGVFWILIVVLSKGSNLLYIIPVFIFVSATHVWAGWAFLRSGKIGGAGKYITGWAFVLWGINTGSHLYFRFLQTTFGELAPWGMLSAVLLKFFIAFGILLVYFQKTRKDLSDRERYFRALIQNAPDVIIIIEADGTARYVSPARERVLGRKADEVLGKSVFPFVHPEDLPGFIKTLTWLTSNPGTSKTDLLRIRHVDGSWRYIEMHGVSLLHDPRVEGIVINYQDITKRKLAEEKLLESEKKLVDKVNYLNALINNMNEIFFTFDRDGRVTFINKKVKDFYGREPQEVIGRYVFEFAPEGCKKEIIKRIKGIHNRELHGITEVTVKTQDGGLRIVKMNFSPIIEDGQYTGTMVLAEDITERRRMEEELREERDRAQKYLDIAGVIFVVIDAAQRVTLINKRGCEILGFDEKEVIGKNWFDNFIPDKNRESFKEGYEKCISGQIKPIEYVENPVLVGNGGERTIAWHNTVLTDEKGKIVATLSSGEDVTEQRRVEAEINEARSKAERAGRLASLGTMAAAIAHEINQPLNAIKMTVDGTLFFHKRGKTIEAGELIKEIADISVQADRIDNIVKRIRSFVRMEPLRELTPCDLNSAVEGALGLVVKQLSIHGIKVNKSLSSALPPVQGDRIRLEEVIINLLVNAMHALDKVEKPSKEIQVTTKVEKDLILEISDNATGISEEIVDKIFDPFFSTKLSDKGMGLGLSIVHSIVISLQGQIKVINNVKGGATFRVEFPVANSC